MEVIEEKQILKAEDVASILDVSKPMAYKVIQKLNNEIKEKGYHNFWWQNIC